MKEFFVLQFWKYLPTDKLKMWWLSEGPYKLFKKPLYDQKTMDWAKKMCQELELSEDK